MLKYFGGAPIMIDCGPHGNMQEAMEYLERKEKREKAKEQRAVERDDKSSSQKEDA